LEDFEMAWKKGPMPPDTYNWGGVVPVGEDTGTGFYFADFCGDHVKIVPDGRVLKAHEVACYDNGLELPPGKTCRG
jgi:hypothetical protein